MTDKEKIAQLEAENQELRSANTMLKLRLQEALLPPKPIKEMQRVPVSYTRDSQPDDPKPFFGNKSDWKQERDDDRRNRGM